MRRATRQLDRYIASGGRWQRLLPGVYLTVTGTPTQDQRETAALHDADGVFIAVVDGWWPEAGVAGEVDSRAYHFNADDQDRTAARHDQLAAHGILPLHFSPRRIKTDPAGCAT